jgi:site-specific DNA-methyltransferase (adenine-specific)
MGFQSNWSKSGPRHRKIEGDITVDTRFIPLCYDKLKEGGGIVVFCNWETSHIWRGALENCGFKVKSQVIWNRLHHGMGDLKGAFAPMHDIIWYASKGRRIFVNGRPKSVKEYKRASPGQDFGHPTVKPLGLIEELIKDTESADRGIILDPFMGSGTTGVACKNLGRDFIGIELDETYFRIAQERIKNNH